MDSRFVTHLGGAGGPDAGDLGADGKKGKGGARGGGRGLGVGSAVKGAAVIAVAEAGFKAYDTYQNAETQDEKAQGYGQAAGGLAGTLAGAAAGAAIGSVVPVIGTVVGGIVGGILGNMGGDALGGFLGKSMFGTDPALKQMPAAGPLMMATAGQNIAPVMGGIAQSFATPAGTQPGDAARAMLMPPPGADAAAALLAKPPAADKAEGVKVDSKVDIQAPFTLTVQGDVKDGAQLYAQIRPYLEQHQREMAQQLENRKLYDAPHI